MNKRSESPVATQVSYLGSPSPPPNTRAEYLVSWRYSNETAGTKRRVFHSHARASAFRDHLERYERQADDPTTFVFVTISMRPVGTWREVA